MGNVLRKVDFYAFNPEKRKKSSIFYSFRIDLPKKRWYNEARQSRGFPFERGNVRSRGRFLIWKRLDKQREGKMINVGIVEDNPEDAQKLSGYLEDFFKNSDQEYSLKVFQSGLFSG